LESGFNRSYSFIFNHSEAELKSLSAYLQAFLANVLIQQSAWPAAAATLFAQKSNSGMLQGITY